MNLFQPTINRIETFANLFHTLCHLFTFTCLTETERERETQGTIVKNCKTTRTSVVIERDRKPQTILLDRKSQTILLGPGIRNIFSTAGSLEYKRDVFPRR